MQEGWADEGMESTNVEVVQISDLKLHRTKAAKYSGLMANWFQN